MSKRTVPADIAASAKLMILLAWEAGEPAAAEAGTAGETER